MHTAIWRVISRLVKSLLPCRDDKKAGLNQAMPSAVGFPVRQSVTPALYFPLPAMPLLMSTR